MKPNYHRTFYYYAIFLYTAGLPSTSLTNAASYIDDAAILASHPDILIAWWLHPKSWNKLKVKVNDAKSTHARFTLRVETCPIPINDKQILQQESAKYFDMHLDIKARWHIYVPMVRKLDSSSVCMYWFVDRNSKFHKESDLDLWYQLKNEITA